MLKVLSLNCQKAYHPNFAGYIKNLTKTNHYDFILLQEANDSVQNILSNGIKSYNLLVPDSENPLAANFEHEICILYKQSFLLKDSSSINLRNPNRQMITKSGCIIGVFENLESKDSFPVIIGCLHLQASYHAKSRTLELVKIRKLYKSLQENYKGICILGGDFNNLGPGERYWHSLNLMPEFRYASHFKDYTHDSAFLEKDHLDRRIAKFFLVDRLKYKSKIDHFYVDKATYKGYEIKSYTIKEEVSDHRPIVMEIS